MKDNSRNPFFVSLPQLAKIPFDYEDMANQLIFKATLNLKLMEDFYYDYHPVFWEFIVYDTTWCISNLKVFLRLLKDEEKKK